MNCRDAKDLLLAERDGVLTTEQHAALASHVTACPACRQFRTALVDSALFLKNEVANISVPDAESEWHAVRAQLRGAPAVNKSSTHRPKRRLAPVVWFGAPLAAAAALVFAFLNQSQDASEPMVQVAQANYVEAGDTTASTMVYVDKESGWLVVWASGDGSKDRG